MAMRLSSLLPSLVVLGLLGACNKPGPGPADEGKAQASGAATNAKAEGAVSEVQTSSDEGGASKSTDGEDSGEDSKSTDDGDDSSGDTGTDESGTDTGDEESGPEPESAAPSSGPAARWLKPIPPTPARAAPDPTSVLGKLPKAEAIALVAVDKGLELVAVGPSGWRLRLVEGTTHAASFEPTTGLVVFIHADTVSAIDLLEPRAEGQPPVPEPVVLAQLSDKAESVPDALVVCVPKAKGLSCHPDAPMASDVEPGPHYVAVHWDKEPGVVVHPGYDWENDEELDPVDLKLLAGDWLKARADRLAHFSDLDTRIHSYWRAEPLDGVEWTDAMRKTCLDAEDCGKSLPLGVSGWEWVVVASDQGDLFHPMFAVYDPATKRWASWTSLLEGKPKWIAHADLAKHVEELADEHYALFDAGGRVFEAGYPDRLCTFEGSPTSGVRCVEAGGEVRGFLNISIPLGAW